MNKKELIKNLITDIQDIYTITNRFENTENIHSLDIDLALSKVRNLYELLLKLNPQGSYLPENQEKEISTPVKKEEKPIAEVKNSPPAKTKEEPRENKPAKQEDEPETKPKKVEQQPDNGPELIIESATEKTENKEEESSEENQTDPETSTVSPEIVADRFHSKRFVHDDISKKNVKKDVSSKMQSKPIQDINSAIGLNDKFIFIRELFDNNKDQYLETIQILNNFDTYENAVTFLNENFDWDSEDPNFERLKELVRRKYATK